MPMYVLGGYQEQRTRQRATELRLFSLLVIAGGLAAYLIMGERRVSELYDAALTFVGSYL